MQGSLKTPEGPLHSLMSEAAVRHAFKGHRYDDPYPETDLVFFARVVVDPDDDAVEA